MDLRSLGEFGLIELLRTRLPAGEGVETGVGDDAAVVALSGPAVLTTDMMVEGVHFDLTLSAPADVGYKAVATSVSDIAAMGARPRYALVALGAPANTPLPVAEGIIDGIVEAGKEFGVTCVGGDTVASPSLVLSLAIVGEAPESGVVLRSGARPGDALCVTGSLGASAAGLSLLRREDDGARSLLERFPVLAESHRRGRARVREGGAAAAAGVHAMIDVSDGLAADAMQVARESGVGVVVEAAAVPLAAGVSEAAALLGTEAWTLGADGGEDYELLIACAPASVDSLRVAIGATGLSVAGRFTSGGDSYLETPGGERLPLAGFGWEHFR
jgi:thiamine-monophosphate kinase